MTIRVFRGKVVAEMVRRGWRPPPLRDDQAQRLLDDIARIGGDQRGRTVPRSESLRLTDKEARVLALIAHGDTAKQVAGRIQRSPETVKTQEKLIRAKLGARNTTNAVAIAIHEGLIESRSGWREAA